MIMARPGQKNLTLNCALLCFALLCLWTTRQLETKGLEEIVVVRVLELLTLQIYLEQDDHVSLSSHLRIWNGETYNPDIV